MVTPVRDGTRSTSESKSLPTLVSELRDLVVAYAKQETIVPIRNLGRFVAFGLAGSTVLSLGLVMLALAMLRALQTETGSTFTGKLTWAPYLLTLAACGVVIGLAGRGIGAAKRRRGAP